MKPTSKTSRRFILSGGGTGGHIYPAIAIANRLKECVPNSEFLFVGASDKMEMEKVPKAGFDIQGLWISGFDRSNLLSNAKLPFKLLSSINKSNKIIKDFKPDLVVGTGGYASGPLLWSATQKGIPALIQEQNSFPGITNKLLKNKAFAICTAYDNMEKHFPKEKIHLTGNPIRSELFENLPEKHKAKEKFNLDPNKKVILSVGGSLGSRTLNNAWASSVQTLVENDTQLIWQTGKLEYDKIKNNENNKNSLIKITEFIYDMQMAYAAADVIVSRAGAMAISELSLVGKPTIFVPFPFAAEDHQTQNAKNLVNHKAAKMITDKQATNELANSAINLLKNEAEAKEMSLNLKRLAKPNATKEIVDIITEKLNLI